MAAPGFVGHEREMAKLQTYMEQAVAGHGQVVFISGEAGAGKTAFVTEFARRAQDSHPDLLVAVGNCNAQTGIGDPYLPFRELLGMLTGDVNSGLAKGAITKENANRLHAFLRVSGQTLVEYGPDLVDLFVPGAALASRIAAKLSQQFGWRKRLEELTYRKTAGGVNLEQSRIFEQYTGVLQAVAAQKPLILVLDDLHWVDVSSVSLLFHLGRRIGESRILLVGTYRPEDVALGRAGDTHPLEGVISEFKRYFGNVWIELDQTSQAEGRAFVDTWLDREPNRLNDAFRQALFRHTEGHALFTIEMVHDLQERGYLVRDANGFWVAGVDVAWEALATRVEGVIEAHISRLADELRTALTIASVEGEEFTVQVLARIQKVEERPLARQLSQELDRQHRLIQEHGVVRVLQQRLGRYRFRHALFQKYLYDSLGDMERMYLHEDVGTVLEALYGDQTELILLQLARHFQAAGITEKAIHYLYRAGTRAVGLSANAEAILYFNQGLALINTLPDTPERARQELQFQMLLGPAYRAIKGIAAPEVKQVYTHARALCGQFEVTPELLPVLFGLWLYSLGQGELQSARTLAEQSLSLAERQDDLALLVSAHRTLGTSLYYMGELTLARKHFEQGFALYDRQQHQSQILYYGQDAGVLCLAWLAYALWHLGYPDQALSKTAEATSLAHELSHPHSLAYALYTAANIHQFRREAQATLEQIDECMALSSEHGFSLFLTLEGILRGWALAVHGQAQEGIRLIQEGIAVWVDTGQVGYQPYLLALLAEAYAKAGKIEDALTTVAAALSRVEITEERFYEAELYRLQGELLLMQANMEAEAAACFQRAISTARQQQGKSFELRAVMSLSRQLEKQGNRQQGQQMLAEVLGWFREGFGTADLKEAKKLLEKLS